MNVTMAQEVAVRAAVRAATRKEIKDVDVDRIVEAALATRPALTRSERELHDLMTRMFQPRRRVSTLREIRDESRGVSSGNIRRTLQRLVETGEELVELAPRGKAVLRLHFRRRIVLKQLPAQLKEFLGCDGWRRRLRPRDQREPRPHH